MRKFYLILAMTVPIAAGGCVTRTATDLAALPLKATGKVVDWSTTSPSEADRNYARRVAYERAQDRRMAERHCRAFPEDCAY